MNNETKISIGILIVGLIGIGVYWFWPQNDPAKTQKVVTEIKERIILPQYDPKVYRQTPQVQQYISDLKSIIANGQAVLPLPESELDEGARKAQEILLNDPKFLKDTRAGDKTMHNDMMRILPAIVSSLDEKSKKICAKHKCYQAEKYNFVTNATTRAIVDVESGEVLKVDYFPNTQPDISYRLQKIAEAIALNAPEVKKELGHTPHKNEITMANVRGSMKESPCENTMHLCVAPTFADQYKEQALWAVVDLTDMRLAAAKWAGLGKTTTPACISERTLENRYIMENFCQKDNILKKNGWEITYHLTASDGLEIRNVKFHGKPVLRSAKIVDWHVAYKQKSGGEDLDTAAPTFIEGRRVEYVRGDDGSFMFGYNDAMGCPMFSTSVVLAFNGPQIRPLQNKNGFMLTQDFRNPKWPMACNYRYENRFEFYDDGSFRVVGVNKGRGCGDNALYRPVMRIDLGHNSQKFYSLSGEEWKLWEKEGVLWQAEGADRVQGSGFRVRSSEFGVQAGGPSASSEIDQSEGSGTEPDAGQIGSNLTDNNKTNPELYLYKIAFGDKNSSGYYIEPNRGQFGDGSRGDRANLFVTRFHESEGDKDMLTLGSCCKLDEDGPERFVSGENIKNEHLVIWYIPHIRNDSREGHEYCWADTRIGDDGNAFVKIWPCTVGPKFVPISSPK